MLEEHATAFRWFALVVFLLLVARFVLEGLGLWPWA